jgi:NAD(P)-dependent dehydrogenase (short-subunit alcohol dehydrogenase family)
LHQSEEGKMAKTKTMIGKVALVTGAGMGIGFATALAFAQEGANVVAADIDGGAGKETVRLIEQAGAKGLFVKCDVSKAQEVKAMVEATVGQFGRLDFACNNAGIHAPSVPTPLPEIDDALWDRVMEVNMKSVFMCMKHEIPPMERQGSGVIVNIASLAGLVSEPGFAVYTASKHGVMGLTKAAAFDYAKKGIRINAVCPAPIDTPMVSSAPKEVLAMLMTGIPMGRLGKAEEVAGAVIWLCSDLAAFVTGIGLVMDGGVSTV